MSTTSEKRWICSADKGPDSMILIWENVCGKPENAGIVVDQDLLLNAYPIKAIYDPHGGYGTVAAAFTHDGKYLITLGNG